LVLIEFNSNNNNRFYQDSTWLKAGNCGPIQLDPFGNTFVGPIPVINILDNPIEKQNTIYKVGAITGKMEVFAELPLAENTSVENPYGILGFTYLCETNTLYASSVHGSNRQNEMGSIYAIDANNGNVIDKIKNIDALGMGISYITGQRKLYFGSARSSDIFSVVLNKKGGFSGKPQLEFSIANIGPRGDDKVRRIKFDKATGNMQLSGVEFNFNLTAPTEKQETVYTFSFDNENKKWEFVQ
jgi:hypothetical protein